MLPQLLAISDFTPISPSAQLQLASLVAAVAAFFSILQFFRRKPTVDSDLTKLTEALGSLEQRFEVLEQRWDQLQERRDDDLRAQRQYTRETTREIFEKIDAMTASVAHNFQAVERAIGRLEGGNDR